MVHWTTLHECEKILSLHYEINVSSCSKLEFFKCRKFTAILGSTLRTSIASMFDFEILKHEKKIAKQLLCPRHFTILAAAKHFSKHCAVVRRLQSCYAKCAQLA